MFLDIVDSGNDVLSRAIGLFRMALAIEPVALRAQPLLNIVTVFPKLSAQLVAGWWMYIAR
jgi:hypothetical protein